MSLLYNNFILNYEAFYLTVFFLSIKLRAICVIKKDTDYRESFVPIPTF